MRRSFTRIILSVFLIGLFFCQQMPLAAFADSGNPFKSMTIPGEILMCDFDMGGEGVAYRKGSPTNGDSDYRAGENMNLYQFSDGIGVAFEGGMWANYTVTVAQAGYYMPTVYYATPDTNTVIAFEANGESKADTRLTPTPNYIQMFSQEADAFYLKEGKQTIRIGLDSGGITLYKVAFQKTDAVQGGGFEKTEGSFRSHILPTKIEAEDFDLGKSGSYSTDGKNNGKKYRKDEAIDIFENTDGGYYISLSQGEYTKYSFVAPASGAYCLQMSAKGATEADFYVDDVQTPLTVKTVGRAFEEMQVANLYFKEGEHNIRIAPKGSLSIDYIKLTTTKEDGLDVQTLSNAEAETEEGEAWHPIYKELYVSANGSDTADGSEQSPFQTIGRAKQEICAISPAMDGDIVIHILPGYYQLEQTEVFGIEHSGKNGFNVIIRGSNALNKPIISGGTRVTGWQKYNDYIYRAPFNGDEDIRTLYINGFAAQRARSKYRYRALENYKAEGSENVDDGVSVSAFNFPKSFARAEDLELVWDMDWTCQRTPVADVQYADGMAHIIMDQPYYNWTRTRDYALTTPGAGGQFYIENAMELLDEPGEFYYNKAEQMIYYYPFRNESLNTSEIYAGTCELMLSVMGNSVDERVSNLIFENLDFRYGAWNELNKQGMVVAQADKIINGMNDSVGRGGTIPPSQLTIQYATGIQVRNCEFSCLGSGAISMPTAVSDAAVIGNSIHDISGSGIIVGSWDHNEPREGMEQCSNIDIMNNAIIRVAREFRGSCGISVYYEKNINILHNDLRELPYTGITLGWGWGEEADFGNIKVSYNRIEDAIIPPIFDGAHIYTLGPLRNSELSYNYLLKTDSKYGGIYPDSGSSYMKVHDNVIEGCPHWFFGGLHQTHDLQVYHNFSDTDVYYNYGDNDIEQVILVENGEWPEEARSIMENAGLEPQYKRLLSDLAYPAWRTNFVKNTPKETFEAPDHSWLEAEDFKEGGEGVGYHKLQKGNNEFYRKGDVLIYQLGDGSIVIGTTFGGEWLAYDVDIPETGLYDVKLKAANAHYLTNDAEPYMNVYVDGVLAIQSAPVKHTASWQINLETTLSSVRMEQGTHEVRFEFAENGISFDGFKFVPAGTKDSVENSPDYDEGKLVREDDLVTFTDIQSHWAKSEILSMAKKGIILGMGNKQFVPEGTLTKEQAILLVMRAASLSETASVEEAQTIGLVSDLSDLTVPITREAFVSMVMRAYLGGHEGFLIEYKKGVYQDENDISQSCLVDILGAKKLGIATGSDDGCFYPQHSLTRAEAAVVISRFMNNR